jgi:hypothetical protein
MDATEWALTLLAHSWNCTYIVQLSLHHGITIISHEHTCRIHVPNITVIALGCFNAVLVYGVCS